MPEQEFEIYLSLLSRLLRLNPAQKAAISDELRDHLEERLNVLIQSGVSREQAIKLAMEEFGDVTGLALDLTKASRTPFRKVAVRSTVAVSVIAILIVGWLSLFAPEHRIAAPRTLVAQQPQPANDAAETPPASDAPSQLAALQDEELFPDFLTKRTDVHFDQVPLTEVCHQLETLHQIPVIIHRSALAETGIDPSLPLPVSLTLTGQTFEDVLNQLAQKVGLAWQVDGGVIQITTPERVRLMTRQFDLHELVKLGHTIRSLIDILHMTTDKWADLDGGEGKVAVIGESLVVRQTYHHQRKIAQVLAIIAKPPAVVQFVGNSTGRDRLLEALKERAEIAVVETPLTDVIKMLAEKYNVPIVISERHLVDESIDLSVNVSLTLKNRPLGKLLDDLLDELSLTHQIRNGVIQVTTLSHAKEDQTLIAYNVRELTTSEETLGQLLQVILRTTSGPWEEMDGEGGNLARTDVGSVLFVKQTDKVHAEIQRLVEQLKRTWKNHVADKDKAVSSPPSKSILRTYQMPTEIASGLPQTLPQLLDQETWNSTPGETPAIIVVPSSPNLGGQLSYSTLVVRQTPEVHRQIQKLLHRWTVSGSDSPPMSRQP